MAQYSMPSCINCKKKKSVCLDCKCCSKQLCTRCIDMSIHDCKQADVKRQEHKLLLQSKLIKIQCEKVTVI